MEVVCMVFSSQDHQKFRTSGALEREGNDLLDVLCPDGAHDESVEAECHPRAFGQPILERCEEVFIYWHRRQSTRGATIEILLESRALLISITEFMKAVREFDSLKIGLESRGYCASRACQRSL